MSKTSLYVGNIAESLPDIVLRQMLSAIGTVQSWNRFREPSGKLTNFGFCDFENPEACLRALRVLSTTNVDGCTFAVSVDQKNKATLENYMKSMGRAPELYSTTDGALKQGDDQVIEQIAELIKDTASACKVQFRVTASAEESASTNDAVSKELKAVRDAVNNPEPAPVVDEAV